MGQDTSEAPVYVIKVDNLPALNYLAPDHPAPQRVEWINRGTDQRLKASSTEMLLRTLFRDVLSPSAVRLHRSAGLRVIFQTEAERDTFAKAFAVACDILASDASYVVSAIFDNPTQAQRAISELKFHGVPDSAISVLWKASQFLDMSVNESEGHSMLNVAGAVAGGGIAGALLGVTLLVLPGVGTIAAAGAIAASAYSSVAAVSAAIGATGGAIARMLTDHDVDGVSANFFEQQIKRGKIFVSVDTRISGVENDTIRRAMAGAGEIRNFGTMSPFTGDSMASNLPS